MEKWKVTSSKNVPDEIHIDFNGTRVYRLEPNESIIIDNEHDANVFANLNGFIVEKIK